MELHQRDESVDLGLLRAHRREDAPEAERVLAKLGAGPIFAGSRRVSLVEDQVDDLQHRREPRSHLRLAWDLERHASVGQRPLRPDDALGHRRFRDEERPGDLLGRQASEQAQGQGGARLPREDGVARREDQAQEIVAHVVLGRGLDVLRRRLLPRFELVAERLVLALGHPAPPDHVDRLLLRDRHEPGAGLVRDARDRPVLERGDERVVRELFGEAHVADHARKARDQLRRLDPIDRVDRAVRVGDRHGPHQSSGAVHRASEVTRRRGPRR